MHNPWGFLQWAGRLRTPRHYSARTPDSPSRRPSLQALSSQPERAAALSMKNGLYSIHIHMLDGVRGRDSGVLLLRNGVLIGGGAPFLAVGSLTPSTEY